MPTNTVFIAIMKALGEAVGFSFVDGFIDKNIFGKNFGKTTNTTENTTVTNKKAEGKRDELFMLLALTAACNPMEVQRLGFYAYATLTPTERTLFEEAIRIMGENNPEVLENISDLLGYCAEKNSKETVTPNFEDKLDADGNPAINKKTKEKIRVEVSKTTVKEVAYQNDMATIVILGITKKARREMPRGEVAKNQPKVFVQSVINSLEMAGVANTRIKRIVDQIKRVSGYIGEGLSHLDSMLEPVADAIENDIGNPDGVVNKVDTWFENLRKKTIRKRRRR